MFTILRHGANLALVLAKKAALDIIIRPKSTTHIFNNESLKKEFKGYLSSLYLVV